MSNQPHVHSVGEAKEQIKRVERDMTEGSKRDVPYGFAKGGSAGNDRIGGTPKSQGIEQNLTEGNPTS